MSTVLVAVAWLSGAVVSGLATLRQEQQVQDIRDAPDVTALPVSDGWRSTVVVAWLLVGPAWLVLLVQQWWSVGSHDRTLRWGAVVSLIPVVGVFAYVRLARRVGFAWVRSQWVIATTVFTLQVLTPVFRHRPHEVGGSSPITDPADQVYRPMREALIDGVYATPVPAAGIVGVVVVSAMTVLAVFIANSSVPHVTNGAIVGSRTSSQT